MTTIEALRLQLDNLQKEKQELEVRNLKLSQNHCNREAVVELQKERDQWKEDWERVTVENVQLKALYEEALKHMSDNETNSIKSQQTITALQEQIEVAQANVVQCWKCKYEKLEVELNRVKQQNNELKQKIIQVEASLELQCFRAESRVRKQGYVVSREGISADVQKVEAVRSFPRPTNLTSLRSLLGLASYYRRFIPNFSTVASLFMHLHESMQNFIGGSLSK